MKARAPPRKVDPKREAVPTFPIIAAPTAAALGTFSQELYSLSTLYGRLFFMFL
jgi:hypothetical protein